MLIAVPSSSPPSPWVRAAFRVPLLLALGSVVGCGPSTPHSGPVSTGRGSPDAAAEAPRYVGTASVDGGGLGTPATTGSTTAIGVVPASNGCPVAGAGGASAEDAAVDAGGSDANRDLGVGMPDLGPADAKGASDGVRMATDGGTTNTAAGSGGSSGLGSLGSLGPMGGSPAGAGGALVSPVPKGSGGMGGGGAGGVAPADPNIAHADGGLGNTGTGGGGSGGNGSSSGGNSLSNGGSGSAGGSGDSIGSSSGGVGSGGNGLSNGGSGSGAGGHGGSSGIPSTGGDSGSGTPSPGPGDVAMVELLINPTGTDTGREWIEIVNRCAHAVSLANLHVADAANDATVDFAGTASMPAPPAPLLAPGARAILIQSGDATKNGGIMFAADTSGGTFGTLVSLNNDADTISICVGACATGILVDRVSWDASLGAGYDGHALVIDETGRRCPAALPFGTAGSFGTPFAPNPSCP